MWIESSTAIGMMKIGIMLLMMWIVLPVATSRAIVTTQLTTATIIGERIRTIFLKKSRSSRKMISMASGAETAICLNISTPKVSSAIGRPVMWYSSPVAKVAIFARSRLATRKERCLSESGM